MKNSTTLAETDKKEAKREGERFLLLYDFYGTLLFCFYAVNWPELVRVGQCLT